MIDKNKIYNMVDYTNLNKTATIQDIIRLCSDANSYKAASVCVPPIYVDLAATLLNDSDVKVCTVIGFPNGYSTTSVKKLETIDALNNGADEIDMVININTLKEKKYDYVLEEIRTLRAACDEFDSAFENRRTILKVIVETCLLTEDEIIKMCEICIAANADFIKTSTGFDKAGATVSNVSLMKKSIGDRPLKIKASGGIRSLTDAEAMIDAGADRIGASKVIPSAIHIKGVPSGDYESFCWDIDEETFVKLYDKKPDKYDKSEFYNNLYRCYSAPDVPILKQYENSNVLLDVAYNDFGIIDITPTEIKVEKK